LGEDGIEPLPIALAHALRVAGLPRHHVDPFDRLLVAQAELERCALLTADPQLVAYDIEIVWGGRGRLPPRPSTRSTRRRRL
jgi:PIN domain nuclease of toxin-antitoxin system